MSLQGPDLDHALRLLLEALQSTDNVVRTTAENQLNTKWVVEMAHELLRGLVVTLQQSMDISTRLFASVLFRRIATKNHMVASTEQTKELFFTLESSHRNEMCKGLLNSLESEQHPQVRNKVGDAIAEIARQYIEEGESWPELLISLFKASQSTEPGQRETAFRILSATPGIVERQPEEGVLPFFANGLKDSNITVRVAAMDAFSSYFRSLDKENRRRYYGFVTEILNILPPIKESEDSEQLSKALESLMDLAEVAPKMFQPVFNALVNFSITVIQDKELDDEARQGALELMATFADSSPQMCRKDMNYTNDMVTQCLSLMTDIGDDDDDATVWNLSEDLDFDESNLNHIVGEQCMDRLANRLGGKAILGPTFNWLPRMMSSSSWRDRHAALMAISAISEGCEEMMAAELDKILDLVVPALQDGHPRVRWAGCNALGQMSTDFAGTMQKRFHGVVLRSIMPVLRAAEPRVQAHAAAALVNFCEEADEKILEPYLDALLTNLLHLLQSNKRFVQEQALSTIATVADAAKSAFAQYYGTLMPLLFNVLREEHSEEYRLLRAKAMECATLIGLAVGKEKMGSDASTLVNILGGIQQRITSSDDPQASYLLHCWGRMCRVLGQDFQPYLPAVMPPLIQLAGAKAEIQLMDHDDQAEAPEGCELIPLKGQIACINTSTLDDKHMAIELIVIYAQALEGAFEPYVDDIMDTIAIPGLAFFFHEPVRAAAAHCVAPLLNCCLKRHGGQTPELTGLWSRTVDKVLEVLGTDPTYDTLAEMYRCFHDCVNVMGRNCLAGQHMADFIVAAKSVLEDYRERVKTRLEEQAEYDYGEDVPTDVADAIEDEQTLLSEMSRAFHIIFQTMGQAFLPHWASFVDIYDSFATDSNPMHRQWAICIYDDVLEFCGPESWNYKDKIAHALVNGIRDDSADNMQAAVYGVGVAAQHGGDNWLKFVLDYLPVLFEVVERPEARTEGEIFVTENACASIAKIIRYQRNKLHNVQGIINAWVDTLPIVTDEEAAPHAYDLLGRLMIEKNPAVMSKASQCVVYVAQALDAETLDGIANGVYATTNQLVQTVGLDVRSLLPSLDERTRNSVQRFFV